MDRTQLSPIAPPSQQDKTLADFASVLNRNIQELFRTSHEHTVLIEAPTAVQGAVGDIQLVQVADPVSQKLYIKFPNGWYYVSLTAA